MKLTNKQYDNAKSILLKWVPALITMIVALGGLYNFDTEVIVGTIAAIATFAGAGLGISSEKYHAAD